MSLDAEGFLSPEIQTWIKRHRAEHPRQFELAARVSALFQRLLLDAQPADSRDQVVMIIASERGG